MKPTFQVSAGDSGWIAFPYSANYQAAGGAFATPGYRKIGDMVYLRGLVTRNTADAPAGSTAGTLPAGFLPLGGGVVFEQVLSGVRCRVDVESSGAVKHQDVALTVAGWLSLDGIVFSTLP